MSLFTCLHGTKRSRKMSRTFVNHKQVTIDYLTELENNIKLDIAKMINAKHLFTENRKLIFELPGEKKIRLSLRFTEKKAIFENLSGSIQLPLGLVDHSSNLVKLGRQLNSVGHTIAVIKSKIF